jgi:membrane protease YdiL (CAAX protease family)
LVVESPSSANARTAAMLAPRWHTAALAALLLAVALTGTLLEHFAALQSGTSAPLQAPTASRIWGQYVPLLAVNWGLFLYCAVLFRKPNALPALLGARWHTPRRAAVDLALALALIVVVVSVELAWSYLFGSGRNAAIAALAPSTEAERLTWAFVAVSVGFCEEIVYRGYLQTQLGAFTHNPASGVALQAVLFGLAHLEQGAAAALRIALYGMLLGTLAQFRRSLLPGIACHIAIDLAL